MANVVLLIANPTAANVVVNAQTAVARKVTELTIADTTTDAYGFLAAGCVVISKSAQADLSKRAEAALRLYLQQHLG